MRMVSAAGTRGRPGMVMISPVIATTNSAPAESRSSRTGTVWPVGAPRLFGSVENEYWVLAMQIGSLPKPPASRSLNAVSTEASQLMSAAR
jgi:hypothetical protein